ncbi:hypothetical protein I3760_06G055500 [Carya illinoinensis]|nr:hypothetical protein I3760_06G055500 [Carya illinoinensis]
MGGQLSTHTKMSRETEPCTSAPIATSLEAETVDLCSNIGDHFLVIVDSNGDRVKRLLHSIHDIRHLPEGERIEMELNNLGQPIKKQDSKVVRFGSLIARSNKLVPIIYKDWRLVPKTIKEEAWGLIKGKFKVHDDKLDIFKKWILKDLGKKWKDYKHELKKKLLNKKDTFVAQVVARASLDIVDLEQLAELANLWFDPEYMVEMKELLTQDTNSIEMGFGGTMTWASDDIYSKVMGPKRPGCVCGLGFGPTSTRQTCQHSVPTSNQEDGISKEEFEKMQTELTELRNLASGQNRKENEEKEKDEKEENAEEEEDQEEDEEEEENDKDND